MENKLLSTLILSAVVVGLTSVSFANPITGGDLVVTQIAATGSAAAPTSAATAQFLQEFTTAGASVQTIALPTAASGSNRALTASGSATSEGQITLSSDGSTLVVVGYDLAAGTAGAAATTNPPTNRAVGLVSVATGNVDSSTALTDVYSGNNIRAAYLTGTTVLTAGTGVTTNGGVHSITADTAGTSTQLASDLLNIRVVKNLGGTVYLSSSSGAFIGISSISSGTTTLIVNTKLPASGGIIPGATVNGSPYDFLFSNANTLYVADDRITTGGGIEKFSFLSGNWVFDYSSLIGTAGARGITTDGSSFYVITTDNKLVQITDSGSAFTTQTVLATAPTNTNFRGVEFVPATTSTPEPASLTLLTLGTLTLLSRRRK